MNISKYVDEDIEDGTIRRILTLCKMVTTYTYSYSTDDMTPNGYAWFIVAEWNDGSIWAYPESSYALLTGEIARQITL